MRTIPFPLTILLFLSPAGGAQDAPKPPKGNPPQFGLASATLKVGKVVIDVSEFRRVIRLKLEKNDVFIEKDHWAPLVTGVLGKDIRAYRSDGKPADAKEVVQALAKPRGVAYFLGYKARPVQPDPFYLNLLREGSIALAIDLPGEEPPVPPAASP